MTQNKNRLWFLHHLSSYSINFSINSLQGLDGCKRIALDDNLAIALVFNTNKQMHINVEMTFVLYSENQEHWAVFRVLGLDLIIENALKNLEKWPKNQENIYLRKGIVLTIVQSFKLKFLTIS